MSIESFSVAAILVCAYALLHQADSQTPLEALLVILIAVTLLVGIAASMLRRGSERVARLDG